MPRKIQIYYGWWVLIACGIIQLFFSATLVYGFSALINHIVEELGWPYALVSLAFTFRGFEVGIFAPIIGFFVDKYQPRIILLIGSVLGALGLFLFSHFHSLTLFFLSAIILGIALSMSSSTVVMTVAAHWFKKRAGLAMGILSVGSGAGGLAMPLIILLITHMGWRTVLVIYAITALLIIAPLSILVKEPPKEETALFRKERLEPLPAMDGLSVKEILKQKKFWLLASALLLTGISNSAIQAHQIPYLISAGLTLEFAGYLVMIFSVSGIIGRLGFGWLGDLLPGRTSYFIAATILITGLAIYAYAESITQAILAVVILGMGIGGVLTLRSVIQLQMFGRRAFATIQGMLVSGITFGSMLAPLFAGWIFDTYETYRPAWLIFLALTFAAIPLILNFQQRNSGIKIHSSKDGPKDTATF
jgi:MFS family permease